MTSSAKKISIHQSEKSLNRLKARYRSERTFKYLGLGAIIVALAALAFLLFSITSQGFSAFLQYEITLNVSFDEDVIDPDGERDQAKLGRANYTKLARNALGDRSLFAVDILTTNSAPKNKNH